MKKTYMIKKLTDKDSILDVLMSCSSSLFNQKLNNKSFLSDLAKKFYNNAHVIKICYDNDLVGFSAYYCNDLKAQNAFLSMIVILKKYQSMGAGSALLEYTIEDCKNAGMKNLILEVDKKNETAIKFYLKKRFIFVNKETESSLFMSLSIN